MYEILFVYSPGGKRPGRETDHSHVAPSLRVVEQYLPSLTCVNGVGLN
jgi:hypothetical protein